MPNGKSMDMLRSHRRVCGNWPFSLSLDHRYVDAGTLYSLKIERCIAGVGHIEMRWANPIHLQICNLCFVRKRQNRDLSVWSSRSFKVDSRFVVCRAHTITLKVAVSARDTVSATTA